MSLISIKDSISIYSLKFEKINIESWNFVFVDGVSWTWKTTFMKILSWHENGYSGELSRSDDFINLQSFYFHDFNLLEDYSIEENCLFQYKLFDENNIEKDEILKQLEYYLDLFNLKSVRNKKISKLSSWEYQRVAVIRTFIRDKPILILDEPMAFLDSYNKKAVLEKLYSFHKKWVTIIFSSHDKSDYNFFQDKIDSNLFITYSLDIHE